MKSPRTPEEVINAPMNLSSQDSLEKGEEYLTSSQAYLLCLCRGDEPPPALAEAWRRFYEFYSPRIRAFLRCSGLADDDLNDCSQEVWQAIVAKLPQFQQDAGRGRLSTWIMALARNKSVDLIRIRNRRVSRNLEAHEVTAPLDPRLDPAAEYERRRTLDQVRRILLKLSGKVSKTSFQVLYLRWIEDLPTAEVAAALELTPDQVRFRAHRMKQKLRDLLQQEIKKDLAGEEPGFRKIESSTNSSATGPPFERDSSKWKEGIRFWVE